MRILILATSLFLCVQSCQVASFGSRDQHSLYINKAIPANSILEILSDNRSGFSFEGKNKSKENIEIISRDNKNTLSKNEIITIAVPENSNVLISNPSGNPIVVNLRIYNHSSKIIQNLKKL